MTELLDDEILSKLSSAGVDARQVVSRTPNPKASSSRAEIVTCALAAGREFRLLCKYGSVRQEGVHGHWHGIRYEARVYEELLADIGSTTPTFFGLATTPSGSPVLLLEYVGEEGGSSAGLRAEGVVPAAAWLGEFHRRTADLAASTTAGFLQHFDDEFLLGWAQRTLEYASSGRKAPAWLEDLVTTFGDAVNGFSQSRATLVHGELYRENVLVQGPRVVAIDWESAAVGAGEIDLAALMEGWRPALVRPALRAYADARWPEARPPDFERDYLLARIYLHLRWLGDRPGSIETSGGRERLSQLRAIAELWPAILPCRPLPAG